MVVSVLEKLDYHVRIAQYLSIAQTHHGMRKVSVAQLNDGNSTAITVRSKQSRRTNSREH